MDIKEFLFKKFLTWQDQEGQRRTVTEWAKYLDVPQASLSSWMSGVYFPKGSNLGKLAAKLGPEIYDILGMTRPRDYGDLSPKKRELLERLESASDEDVRKVIEMLKEAVEEQHRQVPNGLNPKTTQR